MEAKLTNRKRKIYRKIFGALSLSSAMFVFEACYGTPQDLGMDVNIQGYVKARGTGLPIPGIKVSIENQPQYELTDNLGKFYIYVSPASSYKVKFEDVDSALNGSYLPKDSVVTIVDKSLFFNVFLDAK
jgi:hypothetical protein